MSGLVFAHSKKLAINSLNEGFLAPLLILGGVGGGKVLAFDSIFDF
jgi:hypothetical protein